MSPSEEYSPKILEEAVQQMSSLPGIGRKSALRLVLNLLRRPKEDVERFSNAFTILKNNIKYCRRCYNITDADYCGICSNEKRDRGVVCVVENIRDVMSVEATNQFKGLYHVLGGIISPMDGIGPSDINIEPLIQRVMTDGVAEVILALSTTMEGDTTSYYIYRRLQQTGVSVTTLSRGVSIGDELQYADELTLGRSIIDRVPFEKGRQ